MNGKLSGLILLFFVSGCALSPGMDMDLQRVERPPPGLKITPITPDLIVRQRQRDRASAPIPENVPGSPAATPYRYRIGARDVLSITVWEHPELTIPAGQYRSADVAGHLVADDGTLFFPYVGTVKVAGMTIQEVRSLLTRKLSRFITRPQLDVRVAAYRSQKVYVVGEIQKPGPQALTDVPLTALEALNRAGGATAKADLQKVNITRGGRVIPLDLLALYEDGDTRQDMLLEDRDVLHIPDRNLQKVFVMGEVKQPASQIIHKGRLTLAEALSDSGGVDPRTSNPAQIYVVRGDETNTEVYHLNGKSPDTLVLADRFSLQARDVVYVETAAVTNWSRVINQILPTIRAVGVLY